MTSLKLARRDTLPEHYPYKDDGCEYHKSCLSCPFPVCVKYEDPHYFDDEARRDRNARIVRLRERGYSIEYIARQFNVGERTVHRAIEAYRKSRGLPLSEGEPRWPDMQRPDVQPPSDRA